MAKVITRRVMLMVVFVFVAALYFAGFKYEVCVAKLQNGKYKVYMVERAEGSYIPFFGSATFSPKGK